MALCSSNSKFFPVVFFIVAAILILLCAGITYGWATIAHVFKSEGFFYYLCNDEGLSQNGTESITNGNTSSKAGGFKECASQRERLNLIFQIGVFSIAGLNIPIGIFLDKYGPRAAMIIGCCLFTLGGIGLTQVAKGTENLLFVVLILFCAGGQLYAMPLFKTSNFVFGKLKSLALCVLNGAFDSSAVVLVLFKVAYDSGFSLQNISIFYTSLSFLCAVAVISLLMPSYKDLLSANNPNYLATQKEHLILRTDIGARLADQDSSTLDEESDVKSSSKNPDPSVSLKDETTDDKVAFELVELNGGTSVDYEEKTSQFYDSFMDADIYPETFKKSLLSPIFILQFLFLTILQMRLWFFIGSLNNFLHVVLGGDEELVGKQLVVFGYVQLSGIIVATGIGLIFDRNLIGGKEADPEESSRHNRLRSSVLAFALTSFFAILMSVLAITNSVNSLVPTFVLLVIVRGFLYAGNATLIGIAFKNDFFGRLYSFGLFGASCFGLLQFPCVVITEKYLGGDPYWINVAMLVLVVIASIHPFYLWRYSAVNKKSKMGKIKFLCAN